jgi:hypothetical protein
MHYQVVVLESEIGSAMDILSLAWQRAESGSSEGHYYGVEIYMGLCAGDELEATFDNNWIPGTRTLVFAADTLDLSGDANDWTPIILDYPYWYGGGQNLLIDLQWTSANTAYSFYTWRWDTGAVRSVKAVSLAAPAGVLSTQMSELMLSGDLALPQITFGGIKTLFACED